MSEELKPCPFCGGEAELKYTSWWDSCEPPEKHDVWSVGCAKRPTHENCCLGRLCMSRGVKDRDKAIEAWNTRAADIVRCKDCAKWHHIDTDDGVRYGECDEWKRVDSIFLPATREDGFCAWGKRRADG